MTQKINWISVTKGVLSIYHGMYEVCEVGLIRRTKDGSICNNITSRNYTYTEFQVFSIKTRYPTKNIVALHFIPNPNNHTDVVNIDFDRNNNAVYNLKWCSRSESIMRYKKEKYVIVQMTMDGEYIAEYPTLGEAAKASGAHTQAITNCYNGCIKYLKSAGGFTWKKIYYD